MRFGANNWHLEPEEEFNTYNMEEPSNNLEAELLVQFSRAGRADGLFKLMLNGNANVHINLPVSSFLQLGGACNYRLVWEQQPKNIIINVNSTTSDWMDFEDLVAKEIVTIELAGGGNDTEKTLLKQLSRETRKTPAGASLRWAVGAAPNGFLELQLQALPVPAAVVMAKPILRQDDIAVIMLKSWPITAECFDGNGHLGGPIPVIFTEQPEEMRTYLEENPDSYIPEFNKLMSR